MLKRPLVIETIDDAMADVLRHKTGVERLQIADSMFLSAREIIRSSVQQMHPQFSEQQIQREIARRIAGDAD
jgi:hypothetical protein